MSLDAPYHPPPTEELGVVYGPYRNLKKDELPPPLNHRKVFLFQKIVFTSVRKHIKRHITYKFRKSPVDRIFFLNDINMQLSTNCRTKI